MKFHIITQCFSIINML